MYPYPLGSCQLCFYTVICKLHFIIARTSHFSFMAETGMVSFVWGVRPSGIQFQFTCSRHNQDIPQIRMSRTTQVGMTESYYCLIAMLVPGTIFICIFLINSIHIVRNCIRIRAQLYKSERSAGPGKGVPHTIGSDNGIDKCAYIRYRRLLSRHCHKCRDECQQGKCFFLHNLIIVMCC